MDNHITSMKFYQEIPYFLNIKIDYETLEAVIEFTGKILKSDYKKLISMDTIRQCFDNINEMGFCNIDIDAVLEHGQVVKCDVTKDIAGIDTPQLSSYIRSNLPNYQNYQCRKLRNGNLIIEKNVTTTKTMKRITIYDKGKEMKKTSNMRLAQDYGLVGEFDNVCRFEMNLNSKPQTDMYVSDKKTYLAMLVLQDNDYDLAKVEAKMREFHPRGTRFFDILDRYSISYGDKKRDIL